MRLPNSNREGSYSYAEKEARMRAALKPSLAALVVVDLEVVALRIERRVDVAQIDAVAVDPVAQDIQIVAVIQAVHRRDLGPAALSRHVLLFPNRLDSNDC